MEDNLANELYSESLRLSDLELGPKSSTANNQQSVSHVSGTAGVDFQDEDGSLWGGSDEESASDLDREWQRRHDQFHTIGYREGLMAGKEASAQEGFNIGFKQSVIAGYNWGLVRGISSALACLPDDLRERLIETQEKRDKFHQLFKSVHSLSTTDALKLFHDDVIVKKAIEQSGHSESNSGVAGLQEQRSDCSHLDNYFSELQSLLHESPSINVHLSVN